MVSAFTYAQERAGTVSGQILDLDGMPARGIRVALAVINDAGQITSDTLFSIVTTDESGRYRFEQIVPGRYGVIAGAVDSPTYFPGTSSNTSAAPIDVVGGRTVDNINFNLVTSVASVAREQFQFVGPLIQISGQIIAESGNLPPAVAREFIPSFSGFAPAVSSVSAALGLVSSGGSSSVNADGTFTFSGYAGGEYTVRVDRFAMSRPDNDYYVKAISFGAIDLLKIPLKTNGAVQDEIRVTLGIIGSIRGSVHTEDGKPAANIQVYLLPGTATRTQYAQMGFSGATGFGSSSGGGGGVIPKLMVVATAVTDDQGNFTVRGTAPGDYSIHSEPTGQDGLAPSVRITTDLIPFQNLTLVAGPPERRLVPSPPR